MLDKIWDWLVRWRGYVVNLVGAAMIVLPDILNAPEVLAVIPENYQKYVLVAALLINIWLRPRPATRAADVEVQAKKAVDAADGPATISVKEVGKAAVVIEASP